LDGERGLPIYANPTFLNFMTEVSGEEKKLNESVFIAGFDEDIVKWKNYYYRALKGESFHIEEHFNYPVSNIIRYSRVTFEPLIGKIRRFLPLVNQKIFQVYKATI
jgi:hypothetical protein